MLDINTDIRFIVLSYEQIVFKKNRLQPVWKVSTMTRNRWDKHSIKAEIYRRGFTLGSLSEALSLSSTDVAVALSRRFPKADGAIAKWLGVELHILWPDRYTANGGLLRQRRQSSRRRRRYTSQKHIKRIGRREAA
jgi:Ner family transcriptional regulator